MAFTQDELLTAAARWVAAAREELARLGADVYALAQAARRRWRQSPQFRAQVLRELLEVLVTAFQRGPRGGLLWLVSTLARLIQLVADSLDDEPTPEPPF